MSKLNYFFHFYHIELLILTLKLIEINVFVTIKIDKKINFQVYLSHFEHPRLI